jgi:hypothetical protein
MLDTTVKFIELETKEDFPSSPVLGGVYFIKSSGSLMVNHGDRIVEYGQIPSRIRFLPPTDFNTATPTQATLNNYAMTYTGRTDVGDHSLILNLFDKHAWVYDLAINLWSDIGNMITPRASNTVEGSVKGSTAAGKVSVDADGLMTANGMPNQDILDALNAAGPTPPSASNPYITVNDVPSGGGGGGGSGEFDDLSFLDYRQMSYANFDKVMKYLLHLGKKRVAPMTFSLIDNQKSPPIIGLHPTSATPRYASYTQPAYRVRGANGGIAVSGELIVSGDAYGKIFFVDLLKGSIEPVDLGLQAGVVRTGIGSIYSVGNLLACITSTTVTRTGTLNRSTQEYKEATPANLAATPFGRIHLLKSGEFFLGPGAAGLSAKYNIVTNTIRVVHDTGIKRAVHTSILPDGNILYTWGETPGDLTRLQTFDVETETMRDSAIDYAELGAFSTTCLIPGGKTFLCPNRTFRAGIYDDRTDTLTRTSEIPGNDRMFTGCCMLPDGRVLLAPRLADGFYAYDIEADTYTKLYDTPIAVTSKFVGVKLTQSGHIGCLPFNYPYVGDINTGVGSLPTELCLHPYLSNP